MVNYAGILKSMETRTFEAEEKLKELEEILDAFGKRTQKRLDAAEELMRKLERDKRYKSLSSSIYSSCRGDYPKDWVSPDGRTVDYPGRWISPDDIPRIKRN
jgi:CRISPR/Cas system Type II protein with McrA/HNH and RuvC-like nuclease domain